MNASSRAADPDEARRGDRVGRAVANAISLCALICVAMAAVAAVPAAADSLAFIRAHNVWLANPDGSGQYQVTFDGTAGAPFTSRPHRRTTARSWRFAIRRASAARSTA